MERDEEMGITLEVGVAILPPRPVILLTTAITQLVGCRVGSVCIGSQSTTCSLKEPAGMGADAKGSFAVAALVVVAVVREEESWTDPSSMAAASTPEGVGTG